MKMRTENFHYFGNLKSLSVGVRKYDSRHIEEIRYFRDPADTPTPNFRYERSVTKCERKQKEAIEDLWENRVVSIKKVVRLSRTTESS